MIRKEAGFSMVELLITMVIFILTIAAATNIFVPMLTQFKQQSKIAETQIEGLVGLDLFRRDIEQAGFGLPWVIPAAVNYSEGSAATEGGIPQPNLYNDSPNEPRAIVADNDVPGLTGSDYLVIKATSIATNDAAMKWAYVVGTAGGVPLVKYWNKAAEDLNNGDNVIVLIPIRGATNQRLLVHSGTAFSAVFNLASFPANFSPSTENDLFLIYGVDPDTALRMPFNRADYYIRNVAGTAIPPRCATGTGILMKSLIRQADGNRGGGIPLLDCVADLQVIFGFDMDDDGDQGTLSNADGSSVTSTEGATAITVQATLNDPGLLRNRLNEVRVYILAHEGQRDPTYTYPNAVIQIPDSLDPAYGLGSDFDLSASGITHWQNYRWKVYTIAVKPNNLRS